MRKAITICLVVLGLNTMTAQRATRVGYLDTDYILSQIAPYNEMRARLLIQAESWSAEIDSLRMQLEREQRDLASRRVLLPLSIIEDKERALNRLEQELIQLQQDRFGPSGDFITQEMTVVRPIQDLIFEVVQDIASTRKFDLILDKSSEVVMLFADPQFDISDLVLRELARNYEVRLTGNQGAVQDRLNTQDTENTAAETTQAQEERKKALERIESEREQRRKAYISKREEVLKARAAREKEIEAQKTQNKDSIN
jgi:Skp family chaperone for outer membrane proteins